MSMLSMAHLRVDSSFLVDKKEACTELATKSCRSYKHVAFLQQQPPKEKEGGKVALAASKQQLQR